MPDLIQVYPNVHLPDDATLGAFVVLGEPPRGSTPGDLPLHLGAGCVIRSHTVIYAGNSIGRGFQCGHAVNIREHNTIGDRCSIGTHSIVEHHVKIGDGVRLHSNVFVPEYSVLEDECWLGPGVIVTNARYPQGKDAKAKLAGAYIERKALIGAGAVLLPGVRIGAEALVGAGAVVTGDVAPRSVVAGNPARVIKTIDEIEDYEDYLSS